MPRKWLQSMKYGKYNPYLCQTMWNHAKKLKKGVFYCWVSLRESIRHQKCSFLNIVRKSIASLPLPPPPPGIKNLRISEFSQSCLFDNIEWEPPHKTDKLLWVMKKNREQSWGIFNLIALVWICKDRMGRLPYYPGYRWNPEFLGSAFLPGLGFGDASLPSHRK